MLDLPMTKGNPLTFATAVGTFTTNCILKIENTMLPCLSTNMKFTAELMVIPAQESNNYGFILGEESMQSLNLTPVSETTQFPGVIKRFQWSLETTGPRREFNVTGPISAKNP